MTQTIRIKRVWLDAFTEGSSGPWPVDIHANLPQSAQIVDVSRAWRTFEDPSVPPQHWPCVCYVEDAAEAPPVSRTLYVCQDGGTREIPDGTEHLGTISWDSTPTAIHLFGVRGPVDSGESAAPAE